MTNVLITGCNRGIGKEIVKVFAENGASIWACVRKESKTFIEYTNDTRISYATRWLIETDLSIGEIGFKCGFNNIANFNRVFKKVKKCTPSDFREEFKGIKRVL